MNQIIENYIKNKVVKTSLREVVDSFKGKAISKTVEGGKIAIINLSDIQENGIDYEHLKTIEADERSCLRYFLQEDDVLVASKGTVKKVAVFEEQNRHVIASANITVLRPIADISGNYIKLFLSSELGQLFLEEANSGKNVMNLNTQKILSIKIPRIPLVKQTYLSQRYEQGFKDYKRKLLRAEHEWTRIQSDVIKNLF